MKSKNYKDLIVWQKSIQLVGLVYELTNQFPKEEIYGLTSQMRRAAISIPSNIAEGSKRRTQKDFGRFLTMSYGSGSELGTQLEISRTLPFGAKLDYSKIDSLLTEIMKMLYTLIKRVGD